MVARKSNTRRQSSSAPDPVTKYARDVSAGKIVAGPLVRLACERHRRDLKEGPKRGLKWNADKATRALRFFSNVLCLTGGEGDAQPFDLDPSQAFIVGSLFGWEGGDGYRRFRVAYIEEGKGNGKALALDTLIPTPSGWATMGLIRAGDQVLDDLGHPCRVVATSGVMLNRPCYRVTFDDGEQVVADANHLWLTEARRSRHPNPGGTTRGVPKSKWGAWRLGVRTTEEIAATLRYANGKYQSANHSVSLAAPLDLPNRDLLVPPYVLGAWLGDGDSDTARLTCAFADAELIGHVASEGVPVTEQKRHSVTTGRFSLSDGTKGGGPKKKAATVSGKLRQLGLLGNKHIPSEYLRSSKKQRLALLQGLLDTDGTISKAGQVEFTTIHPALADGALELIRSLGLKVTVKVSPSTLCGRVVGERYRVQFFAPSSLPVFRLSRKLARQVDRHSRRRLSGERRITACERTGSVPVKCITVDSASSLFLCGRGMIPTHNSPLAAGVGLYMLMADGEWRPEVYSAAVDRDQANILFRDAVAMARASGDISERVIFSGGAGRENNIAYLERGGFFRPIASEHKGRGKSGPRVHCALLDEVHEHPTSAMVEFMRAGTKGRKQALIVLITNAGHDKTTVCYQYHEYSRKTLERLEPEENTDSFFCYVCGLDEGDDWKDEAVWPKANPLLGVAIPHKYLREQVREAIGMPAKQNIVRRLNFCEWTEADAAWLSRDVWDACLTDIDLDDLRGRRCWGGLDLSSKRDLTALSLAFEPGEDGIWDTITFLWTPKDTLRDREDKDRAPYTTWARQGHLIAIEGRVIDYGWVAKQIGDIQEDYDLQAIGYDPHKIEYLEAELDDQSIEVELIAHSQGFFKPKDGVWMPKSVETLEEQLEKRGIRIQTNPVMTWCAASAVVVMDEHENKKFSKKKATGRIDGVVALAMALGIATHGASEPSIYESDDFFI